MAQCLGFLSNNLITEAEEIEYLNGLVGKHKKIQLEVDQVNALKTKTLVKIDLGRFHIFV